MFTQPKGEKLAGVIDIDANKPPKEVVDEIFGYACLARPATIRIESRAETLAPWCLATRYFLGPTAAPAAVLQLREAWPWLHRYGEQAPYPLDLGSDSTV